MAIQVFPQRLLLSDRNGIYMKINTIGDQDDERKEEIVLHTARAVVMDVLSRRRFGPLLLLQLVRHNKKISEFIKYFQTMMRKHNWDESEYFFEALKEVRLSNGALIFLLYY
jgi:hypothetical protein